MQLISVIMPYYQKIKSVNRAIKSIVNQTYKKFELIIVYDDEALEDYYKIKKFIRNKTALITLIAACLVVLISLGVRQTFGLFFSAFEQDLNLK